LRVDIKWIASETLETGDLRALDEVDGVVVPGGFGHRGIEGKIAAARFARTSLTPYLGLCLGMQCAVIEFGRDLLGQPDANSTEWRDHPWLVASQFHPEFRSRPNRPHPLFRDFVKAAAVRAGVLPADAEALEKPAISTDKTSQSA